MNQQKPVNQPMTMKSTAASNILITSNLNQKLEIYSVTSLQINCVSRRFYTDGKELFA